MRARTFFLSELEELNADLLLQVVALVDKAVRVMSGLKNTQSNRLVVDGDIVLVGGKKEPAWCNLPIYILYMKLLLCSATITILQTLWKGSRRRSGSRLRIKIHPYMALLWLSTELAKDKCFRLIEGWLAPPVFFIFTKHDKLSSSAHSHSCRCSIVPKRSIKIDRPMLSHDLWNKSLRRWFCFLKVLLNCLSFWEDQNR
jgi:hypothetical protein